MTKEMTDIDKLTTIISIEKYNSICNKVLDYMLSFESENQLMQKSYSLKREHINRVIGYTEVLTRSLELEQDMVLIAQLAALLHDVGRFEQFKQYQTFNDLVSLDHAELGVGLIDVKEWLKDLPEEIQLRIKQAVYYHNKPSIPKTENENIIFLSQIIRDADKIDILDISIKEFSLPTINRNPFFSLELEDSTIVSKQITKSILAGKLPEKKDVKTITDFILIQMSYVLDINFKKSFSIINDKRYLKLLFEALPKSDDVFEIYRKCKIHIENQLL